MGYVKWLGHAAFEVELDGKLLYIDPWLTGNPLAAISVSDIKRADIVLVTHDHGDHLGDAVEILKKTNAKFVGVYELAQMMIEKGVPEERVLGANIGGSLSVNNLEVVLTPAYHSCSRGTPCGFIIRGKEKTIYHSGDTGLVYELALYSELYPIDIALIPIGSVYTLDPRSAALFTKLIKPKVVIPMHYNTFPLIKQDPEVFRKYVKEYVPEVEVVVLKPGERYVF